MFLKSFKISKLLIYYEDATTYFCLLAISYLQKGTTLRFVLDFTRNPDAINVELLSVHPSGSSSRGNGTLPHPKANKTGKHEELYINCLRVFKNDEYMLIGKATHLFTSSSHFLTSSNHSSDVTSWM